jgi:anaerobic magnesium-protoporphyrin IX monomethyl ester cyclase
MQPRSDAVVAEKVRVVVDTDGPPAAVLVNLPVPQIDDDQRQAPGGLVALATYARAHGYAAVVCDLAGTPTDQLTTDLLTEADVYGISLYTATCTLAYDFAARLRQAHPRAFLVAGGPHASALPEEVLAHGFDATVCGEGEEALVAILERLACGERGDIPDLIRARRIADLDALPLADFNGLCDMRRYHRSIAGLPAMALDSSRGCANRCRFCNSRVMERGCWRPRSPQSVLAEVLSHQEVGWQAFRFNDDSFLADRERALEICRLLQPLDLKFRIFCRAEDLAAPGVCEALVQAGCVHVGVGIESLSPAMLARMAKAQRVSVIKQGLAQAHDAGLLTRGFFIVGFPGETEATVAQTLDTLPDIALDEATCYPCLPYPGTDLAIRPRSYGITWIDPDYSKYIQAGHDRCTGYVMATETFGPDEVRAWRDQFLQALDRLGVAWCDQLGVVR